jgi:hypothetical protein
LIELTPKPPKRNSLTNPSKDVEIKTIPNSCEMMESERLLPNVQQHLFMTKRDKERKERQERHLKEKKEKEKKEKEHGNRGRKKKMN